MISLLFFILFYVINGITLLSDGDRNSGIMYILIELS